MSLFALKHAAARVIGRGYPLDRLVGRPGRRYVMAYHRVIPSATAAADHAHSAMWITPETLAAQIAWMRRVGDVVDLVTLLKADTSSAKRPMFALTFDDGWLDTYTIAFPVLRQAHVPATVFLVSEATEHDRLFWPEDVVTKTHHVAQRRGATRVLNALSDLWPESQPRPSVSSPGMLCESWVEALKVIPESERRSRVQDYLRLIEASLDPLSGYIMSWDQARAMSAHGITFGSHTHTHRILEGLDEAHMTSELSLSRSIISHQLQCDVTLFCYPNARYTGREAPVLSRCGYRYGFIIDGRQVGRSIDPYYVPRFLMSEAIARNRDYVSLHLLEAPLYAGRPHRRRPDRQRPAAQHAGLS